MHNYSNNPPIIIAPKDKAEASVIWLHGLGADANDFSPIVPQLDLPDNLNIRFIFPNAPHIPVTVNANYIMPAWYDILELTEERVINEVHLDQSVNYIHALIDEEIKSGIDASKIMVIGFSQGGAVAYHAALSYPKRLAGIAGLSTYFPQSKLFEPHSANDQQRILICHGSYDSMVLERQGLASAERLKSLEHEITFKSYPMDHEVCVSEIRDLSSFLISELT